MQVNCDRNVIVAYIDISISYYTAYPKYMHATYIYVSILFQPMTFL